MSGDAEQRYGAIGWVDLTVPNAEAVRDFYQSVAGWSSMPVDMGGYSDYSMTTPETGAAVAGVCWSRGVNAGLPAAWLIYITVPDLEESIRRCTEMGGVVLTPPPAGDGGARYCVIRDPAGAVAALYQPAAAGGDEP